MPSSAIKSPYWTRPALLDASREFRLILESRPSMSPAVTLCGNDEIVPVWTEDAGTLWPGLLSYTCTVLGGRPGHTYDLEVEANGQSTIMPNAVSVLPRDTETLTLLHCSDLHLLKPTQEDTMEDRSTHIASLVARINALRPDLVVCTGDLISRYDSQKHALPAEQIRWQIQRARGLLNRVEAPLFVTVGNHDVAFETTRGDWYAAMGGGWKGGTDDFSVDWGAYHLVLMDCFSHYDSQNVHVQSSFTAEQLGWLRQDLWAASASQLRLLFAHYDYHEQLPSLFHELPVDLLLYGHAKGLYPRELGENGVWDGHLADATAYNLMGLRPGGIACQRVSWANLISQAITTTPKPNLKERVQS